jgi:uncharacterized protein
MVREGSRTVILGRSYGTALITGATSGIGAAFADVLPDGTNLLLTGRRVERLHSASERLARPGRRIDLIPADLATPAGRKAVIERAESDAIDLFICNAGSGVHGSFLSHDPEEELESVELNVVACVQLLRGVLPGMLVRARASGGRAGIVIVTSRAALSPVPEMATYAASKAFQLRLAQALADELKQEPVDVLALCPSYTDTEFFQHAGSPLPARELMTPAKVARAGLGALGRRAVHFCGNRLHVFVLLEMLLR